MVARDTSSIAKSAQLGTARKDMIRIDHLGPQEWLEHVDSLTPEEVQKELLRQATDTKLQLISILNAVHFTMALLVVLFGLVLYRMW